MRINFILPFFSARPIGGFKVAYEYANHLVSRGHDVSVVHPRAMRNVPTNNGWIRNCRTLTTNVRNGINPRSGLKWQPLHRNVNVLHVSEPTAERVPDADIVFATAWQTEEYVKEYPSAKGRKFYIVMDFYPGIAPKEVLENTWRSPLTKITISKWLYEKVRQAGCADSEIVNIPIGINFDQFRLLNGMTGRPKRITMLYSAAPSKGSDDGLKALRLCKERHPDLEVVLFGASMRFRPNNLPSWADYKGNISQEQLTKLLNESRIYVCSSVQEGFALPPAEAMACGCAVASTDCGGITEFANHGYNILLSAPNDPNNLGNNILRLLEDESLRLEIAKAGSQSISRFTWSNATDSLETLMASSLGN